MTAKVSPSSIVDFQMVVWNYYTTHGRHDLEWRQPATDESFDPYHIMVSELMLQQTQVARVTPKYREFLIRFPSVKVLAAADLGEVLKAWSGLGYNRRAKFLWQAAQEIMSRFNGKFPEEASELISLPGIGKNTAAAIQAYAFDRPVVFVETNIRTVFIHHFFNDELNISDTAILELVARAVDSQHSRQWYWALMDYGSYLKKSAGNNIARSKHYVKQSTFHGSRRQIRGQVIKQLTTGPKSLDALKFTILDDRLEAVLDDLAAEQLVRLSSDIYSLPT